MRYRVLFLWLITGLLVCSLAYADIPKVINFQGRLTDASGKFVSDGDYYLTFRIYTDSTGVSSKWSEVQSVAVSKGLFNVTLGSQTPIPDSIFNYVNTWLGIQVGADPEMTPRQRLSSLGYSYRGAKADTSNYSKDSDKLDGLHSSDFSTTANDYGRSGVATDLYEGTTTLTSKYVNEGQANSINSAMITDNQIVNADISASAAITPSKISGTAWTSTNDGAGSGLDADLLDGQQASAFLSTASDYGRSGVAADLYEGTSTLTSKYVNTTGPDSVVATSGTAFVARDSVSSTAAVYGIRGYAVNPSSTPPATAYGGFFSTGSSGIGMHMGVYAYGLSGNSSQTNGVYGVANNSSSGPAYAGYFETTSDGTGAHIGVHGEATSGSSSSARGIEGFATNSSTGYAYGGDFGTTSSGTGAHYGIRAQGQGSSDSSSYGVYGYASNSAAGKVYGGYFTTSSSGTGAHIGVVGVGANNSSQEVSGGYFYTGEAGTGQHFGVKADAWGSSSATTLGSYGYAQNSSTGDAMGGRFRTSAAGTGTHYGVNGEAYGASSGMVLGSHGFAQNTSTGDAIGGKFFTSSSGSGDHFGVLAEAIGNAQPGWATIYGVHSYAYDYDAGGSTYGGYFYAGGGGYLCGIYAQADTASGNAGEFDGDVWIYDDLVVGGKKSAAVKTNKGEYRLLYAQESPENWFEDFGKGNLVAGEAVIQIDSLFAQTVNTSVDYHVFLTPHGDCNGLYVTNQTPTSFEVRELKAGNSDLTFSYRIVAKRKGYENVRLAKMEGPTPEEMSAMQAKHRAKYEQERIKMEQENQAMESEK